MPTLLVFDCDGTLVDSQHAIVARMSHAFAVHDLPVPARAAMLGVIGLSLPGAIARLLPDQPVGLVQRVSDAFKSDFGVKHIADPANRDPLFPGIAALIASLRSRPGVVLGIATGKSRRGVARILDREGWQGAFATIQTADTNRSKPDPDMLETAMAETGIGPADTVMIGDTTYDIEMARAAGVQAIGVAWGYHPVPALTSAGAHVIVDDAAALHDRLTGPVGARAAAAGTRP